RQPAKEEKLLNCTRGALGAEWSCPICHDEQEGVAYVTPCGHEFCMGCILRWAEKKPECPLCRRLIESALNCQPLAQEGAQGPVAPAWGLDTETQKQLRPPDFGAVRV
uniref:RING-type domain-containing protein n=1 Tax=Zonotrichia albicollis TaxID=44394 RepID=A0A8D2MNK3_ZONAL